VNVSKRAVGAEALSTDVQNDYCGPRVRSTSYLSSPPGLACVLNRAILLYPRLCFR
jgi:hypothetical protein